MFSHLSGNVESLCLKGSFKTFDVYFCSGMSSVFDNLDMVSEEKRAAITLPENSIRQWAAQVVTALEHLHQVGIVCR